LITFSFSNQECIVEELLTELARHQYSEEYMTLTRDYYLNM
jgi:tRNA1Val (adenine37-N6)-methyltransferase